MATTVEQRPGDPRQASTGELLHWLVDDLDAMASKSWSVERGRR